MENLQEDLDCFQDENGKIEDIWARVITPEQIQMQREANRFHNARVDVETNLK